MLQSFFRNPLVVFVLAGLFIFILYSRISNFYSDKEKRIEISSAQIQLLEEAFTKTWNRQPTEEELERQIENFIKEEVFYREALKIGLDKSDPAVKRRLNQLMELMLDNNANINPTREQLQSFLDENADRFRSAPSISFEHLYFSLDEEQLANNTLKEIKSGNLNPESLNRSMAMVPSRFDEESYRIIDRTFGKDFTNLVFSLEVNEWNGPILSPYGWHLILISNKVEGTLPELEDIWEQVSNEWMYENQEKMKDDLYQEIKSNYNVVVQK